jgi:hypothetical protein
MVMDLPIVCPWCDHVIDHCRVVPCAKHKHLIGSVSVFEGEASTTNAQERSAKETPSQSGQSAQTPPATVEPQMKDELPLPVRLCNLADYAEGGPQSRMVTDMIALMREAADLLNRQSPPPVEGA